MNDSQLAFSCKFAVIKSHRTALNQSRTKAVKNTVNFSTLKFFFRNLKSKICQRWKKFELKFAAHKNHWARVRWPRKRLREQIDIKSQHKVENLTNSSLNQTQNLLDYCAKVERGKKNFVIKNFLSRNCEALWRLFFYDFSSLTCLLICSQTHTKT